MGSDFGMVCPHRFRTIRKRYELIISKNTGRFLLQDSGNLQGDQPDFRLGVFRSAHFDKVPPGTAVTGYEDFCLSCIGKNAAGGLTRELTAQRRQRLV